MSKRRLEMIGATAKFVGTVASAMLLFSQIAISETSKYGSFRHYEEIPGVLFLVGEIQSGDSFEFRRAMRDYEIELVVTSSPGGNLYEGLQLASIINDKGLSTYIPEEARCESACAHVFFGGERRVVLGEIGVHQFYHGGASADDNIQRDIATSATQYTTGEMIGILNEFQTPPFVYEKMLSTDEIHYFRGADKSRLNLGGEDPQMLDLMSKVDAFVMGNPSVLARPPRDPERETTASSQPSKPTPSYTPQIETPEPGSELPRYLTSIDFFGMDLSRSGLKDVSLIQCENYCTRTPACAAYSYVAESRWCWPKSGVQNLSVAAGVTSGIVDPTRVNMEIFDRPFVEVTAMDIVGYDMYRDGLRSMSLDQCRHACLALDGCVAFSWVAKKNWCFPKFGVDQTKKSWGIVSGVRN